VTTALDDGSHIGAAAHASTEEARDDGECYLRVFFPIPTFE